MPLLLPLVSFLPEIASAILGLAFIVAAALVGAYMTEQVNKYLPSFISGLVDSLPAAIENGLNAVSAAIFGDKIAHLVNLLNGVADSVQTAITYPAALLTGVREAVTYLWHTALPTATATALTPVNKAVSDLAGRVTRDAALVEAKVGAARADAHSYADAKLAEARSYTEAQVASAVIATEAYADEAVSKLRTAEQAAVAQAVSIATTAENDATAAFDQAKAYAGQLVAPVGREVSQLDSYIKGLDVPAIAAGATATAALVTALLADTGLSNSECRNKVKGICGTDPNAWVGLLAGIAFMSGALSLREILPPARVIFAATKDLIEQAA